MADLSGPSTRNYSTSDIVVYGSSRDLYSKPTAPPPLSVRSYSASYVYSHQPTVETQQPRSSSFRGSWSFSDPEMQRKKRVATYKAYSMQGKMKDSLGKSFKWVKHRYTNLVYGIW